MELFRFLFSRTFLKHLGLAVIIAGVLFAGVWFYLSSYTGHGDYVTVPNVAGLSLEAAAEKLDGMELRSALNDSVWQQGSEPGTIFEQSPEPGSHVKAGRQIYLTSFRFRPSYVKIGVEEGERQNVARIRLENKGITYRVEYEPHALLYDCVIRVEHDGKSLGPKDEIRRDEQVTLVIGERKEEQVNIPRLFGLSLDSAAVSLEESGLSLGFLAYDTDVLTAEDSLAAWIYEQYPAYGKGQQARVGSEVNLWLTKRPKPTDNGEDDIKTNSDPDDLFDR